MSLDLFLRRAEYSLLLGLAAFLPALEAPKNICVGLYLIVWTVNRLRSGNWGGAWSKWDGLMLALIASAYLASAFAGFPGLIAAAGNDILAYGLVFMTVRRSSFDSREIWWLLGVLVAATIVTLGFSYWDFLISKERRTLGLHSVGHVNHSAIYIAIAFGVALAAACTSHATRWRRWIIWSGAGFLFVSLLVTVARGAIIPALLFVALWMFHWLVRCHGLSRLKYFAVALALAGLAPLMQPDILDKTILNIEKNQLGSYRPQLARVSILAVREFPLFGVGPTQFGKISPRIARQWQSQHGVWFEEKDLAFGSHAHGLYTNVAAERGLLGLSVLLAVLGAWGIALKRGEPGGDADPLSHTLWGAALGGWVLTVCGGLFNTTLHHEHAMITALLMALWMSWQQTQSARE